MGSDSASTILAVGIYLYNKVTRVEFCKRMSEETTGPIKAYEVSKESLGCLLWRRKGFVLIRRKLRPK